MDQIEVDDLIPIFYKAKLTLEMDKPSGRLLRVLAAKSLSKKIAASADINIRIKNLPVNSYRSRRNVDIESFSNDQDMGAYYENDDDDEDLIVKGAPDYLYDETYEDDELFNNSRFGSFQSLFLQAEKNRAKKEREETKLRSA